MDIKADLFQESQHNQPGRRLPAETHRNRGAMSSSHCTKEREDEEREEEEEREGEADREKGMKEEERRSRRRGKRR